MVEGFGGPGRDRTDDLFHAMEARSQLRHRPTVVGQSNSRLPGGDSQTSDVIPGGGFTNRFKMGILSEAGS